MNQIVSKSELRGSLSAPTSKSSLQRHITAAMLSKGQSTIAFESLSADVENVLAVAKQLTNSAQIIDKNIIIDGGINKLSTKINVGESGLALRMLTPILSTTGNHYQIFGSGSLLNRPIDFIVESLTQAGVDIESNSGSLPLLLNGRINKSKLFVDGALSSQLLTGYLMAAPLLNDDVEIIVGKLKSRPYIDLTISILKEYDIEVINDNYKRFFIKSGQKYKAVNTHAEGDWSGVAFLLVAAAISGEITVTNIDNESKQGDRKIVDVVQKVGANVEISHNQITVGKNNLRAYEFDATDTPDLFPPLVALAVNCEHTSKIKGVSRLAHKESDRANTLKTEFEKLGASIKIEGDYMFVKGSKLRGATVHSHNDHRIAMALATAALTINEQVTIQQSEAVAKSWPSFFDSFKALGANIYQPTE